MSKLPRELTLLVALASTLGPPAASTARAKPAAALKLPVPYTVTGTIEIVDYRTWCDPGNGYRYSCTPGGWVGLPHARVEMRDAGTGALLDVARTNASGFFRAKFEFASPAGGLIGPRVYLTWDWTGQPRAVGTTSFQVFYNATVSDPKALHEDHSQLTPLPYTSANRLCVDAGQANVCNLGSFRPAFDTDPAQQQVSTVYLDMDYLFTDSLYVERYHDYCRLNGCSGIDHAIVSVFDPNLFDPTSDASTDNATGDNSGIMVINGNFAAHGPTLHEFGHALQFWAFGLSDVTAGTLNPREAWANFVRLAYRYPRDAPQVIDYDGLEIENGAPLCGDGTPVTSIDNPHCHAEEQGVNWRMAFWDLYDTRQETTQYGCEPMNNAFDYVGDHMIVSFEDLLDAWARFTTCAAPGENHCAEEDLGNTDASTRNMYDFVVNLTRSKNRAPLWQTVQTAIDHQCLQDTPTD